VLWSLDFRAAKPLTRRERVKLADAVRLFICDDPNRWDDAMSILCRLLDPKWSPPASPAPATIQELMSRAGG